MPSTRRGPESAPSLPPGRELPPRREPLANTSPLWTKIRCSNSRRCDPARTVKSAPGTAPLATAPRKCPFPRPATRHPGVTRSTARALPRSPRFDPRSSFGEVDFLPARGGAAPTPSGTKGRALDHIGFDVADEEAAFKRFADDGVMVNMAARDMTQIGLKIGFVTDPNGAYIEVTQGPKNLNDK